MFFFFKQKTAYEMRISDWSSDVCSSDLCDLDAAVAGIARAAFANTGQVCLGTERLYVERPVFDEFVARLKVAAEALVPGAPYDDTTSFGPLISATHRDKVMSYYRRAREEGATVVTGGGVPEMPDAPAGGYGGQPTTWTGHAGDSPGGRW